MRAPLLITTVVFLIALAFPVKAQIILTTTDDTDYSEWGPPTIGDVAFGDTFTVPDTATFLQNFTFTSLSATDTINYQTYLYSFDPETLMATGSALYTSTNKTVPATGNISDSNDINLQLTAGATYIIFVSDASHSNPRDSVGSMGGTDSLQYSGGQFYSLQTQGTRTGFTTGTWAATTPPQYNAAFTATFTSAPEPSLAVLAMLGLIFMIGFRIMQKRFSSKPLLQ